MIRPRKPSAAVAGGRGAGASGCVAAFLSLMAAAFLAASPAGAVSLWGMEGLGRWTDGYDIAARGAGSTAIGVDDPSGMSTINPALIAWSKSSQAHFGIDNQILRIRTQAGSGHLNDSRITGGHVVIAGPGVLRWGLGYRMLTDGTYRIDFRVNQGRPDALERTLTGSGGIGELFASLAGTLLDNHLALGGHIGMAQGALRDVQQDTYTTAGFAPTKVTLRTRVEGGHTWSLGMQARPLPGWTAGAVYHGKSRLSLSGLWSIESGSSFGDRASMDLPPGLGLGLSCKAGPRNRVSFDWDWLDWSSTEFTPPAGTGAAPSGFTNLRGAARVGFGYTHLPGETAPRDPLLRRSIWRAGLSWSQLPVLQASGAGVSEWVGSAGVGFPIQYDRGYVDGLLEIGRTGNLGDVGLRETFVRIGVGITFGRLAPSF